MNFRIIVIAMLMCMVAIGNATAGMEKRDLLITPSTKNAAAAKALLNGVSIAGGRIICVGQRGVIVYSDDQGRSWTQADVPVSSDLVAVHFPSENKGWAVGHDGVVLHSSDSGKTWIKQFDGTMVAQTMSNYYTVHGCLNMPGGVNSSILQGDLKRFKEEGPDKPFLDVWFYNEKMGFIIGACNLVFRTEDGGKTWAPWYDRIENASLRHLYSIRTIGSDTFIVGEQGMILKLDRNAGVFRKMPVEYPGTFFGITGKAGDLVVFGMRGTVCHSQDGGKSWKGVTTNVPVGLTAGAVLKDGRIVLASQGGHVMVSNDNGKSFVPLQVEKTLPASAVAELCPNTLVITGLGGVTVQKLKTGDK